MIPTKLGNKYVPLKLCSAKLFSKVKYVVICDLIVPHVTISLQFHENVHILLCSDELAMLSLVQCLPLPEPMLTYRQ